MVYIQIYTRHSPSQFTSCWTLIGGVESPPIPKTLGRIQPRGKDPVSAWTICLIKVFHCLNPEHHAFYPTGCPPIWPSHIYQWWDGGVCSVMSYDMQIQHHSGSIHESRVCSQSDLHLFLIIFINPLYINQKTYTPCNVLPIP